MAKIQISLSKSVLIIVILFLLYKYFINPSPIDLSFMNLNKPLNNGDVIENFTEDASEVVSEDINVTAQQGSEVNIPELAKPTSDEVDAVTKDNKCGGFVSAELLPTTDDSDEFAEYSPAKTEQQNFLDASRFLSMQTSLLRNTNLQIRPEPEVPREKVCPWNNSTIYRENTEPRKKGFHGVSAEEF